MLRERHDTPPMNPGKWGDFHFTYVPDSFPRIRGSARPLEGGVTGTTGVGAEDSDGRPGGSVSSPLTSAAGRTAPSPNFRVIRSIACSASRQPTGRSPNASWVDAPVAGRSPEARTPTSRSRRPISPDPSYSAHAVA